MTPTEYEKLYVNILTMLEDHPLSITGPLISNILISLILANIDVNKSKVEENPEEFLQEVILPDLLEILKQQQRYNKG